MRATLVAVCLGLLVGIAHAGNTTSSSIPIWLGEPAAVTSLPPHWVPKQAGHYSRTDWKRVIDSTWGAGLPTLEKLAIFDSFWNTVDTGFACFNNLDVNWDSLRAVYRPEIAGGVSHGRFAAIMNQMSLALREAHTSIRSAVNFINPRPGMPLWAVGAWNDVGHFGAGLTPLADSSLLVYRVVDNHPLEIKPGDVVLGYDRRRWVDILRELQEAQLPICRTWCWGSCSTAMTYSLLNAAGMNWHLFDTIDIVKYATGDTLHLPTSLLAGHYMHLFATDQMDVPGVPMPSTKSTREVTCGIVSGTRIGYIYCWRWVGNAEHEFYDAVNALTSDATLNGIIIDFRYNEGGNMGLSDSGLNLLFRDSTQTICFSKRSDPANHLSMKIIVPASGYVIPGNGIGYDKPIAVLVGPGAVSSGDQVAFRMTFHPRVRTFGKSTNSAFNAPTVLNVPNGWYASYAPYEACLASDTTCFLTHREFPVDAPVWHTRDAVADGRDAVVEAAEAWINSSGRFVTSSGIVAQDVLRLPDRPNSGAGYLLDVSGRRVITLGPGANDVSRLSAGVYFLIEAQTQAQAQAGSSPQTVRKVVLTK
jgi:hypothetical protein